MSNSDWPPSGRSVARRLRVLGSVVAVAAKARLTAGAAVAQESVGEAPFPKTRDDGQVDHCMSIADMQRPTKPIRKGEPKLCVDAPDGLTVADKSQFSSDLLTFAHDPRQALS